MKNKIYKLFKSKYRFVLKIFYNFLITLQIVSSFFYDITQYIRYSISIQPTNSKDKEIARLMLLYHSIEKGLALDNPRVNFGIEKAILLLDYTVKYKNKYGEDFFTETSLSVLNQYYEYQKSEIELAAQFRFKFQEFIQECKSTSLNKGGIKSISAHDIGYANDFIDFVSSRHSVRSFSSEIHITRSEIEKAVRIAQTVPSVCNRQPCRVYVYKQGTFNRILDNQLGDQGWARNADKLFIITCNLNYYGGVYERKQAFIDGGMFSMQFVLGLHSQKIATCCKMYIRSPKIDKALYKLTNILPNEVPIMLILAGHYTNNKVIVPYSRRLKMESILNYNRGSQN